MTNYSDYKVWKEVELYKQKEYLSEHTKYNLDDVVGICKKLFDLGEKEGLQGCYLKFQSHMEPYEDYLGSPSVTVCGYRKLNKLEQKELLAQKVTEDLAKELGLTFYEASVVMKLKEQGKI